jgi:hypothetical protein
MNHIVLIASIVTASALVPVAAGAVGFDQNLSAAGTLSAQASGHTVLGSAQLSAGVLAVPLVVGGEIGRASAVAGADLWRAANGSAAGPLPISEQTITAGPPPGEALQPGGARP